MRMSIGELARATDTKVVTIRYYEKIGLLAEPARTAANYRSYGPAHLERVGFIRRCRQLGFTINEIRALLALSEDETNDCAAIDRLAAGHLVDVERKIADLTRLADELRRIMTRCEGGTVGECRVVEALAG